MKLEYLKEYWCSVIVYDHRGRAYGHIDQLHWNGMSLHHLTRWHWYFDYRAALLKVQNPKCDVILSKGQSEPTTKTLQQFYKDKMAGKKKMITKLSNALREYEDELTKTSLFGADEVDVRYTNTKEKLAKYQRELKDLEAEFNGIQ
ncbi:MAG: hypothetical protein ABS44_11755 [Chryseobacterium sp. SCN 40-13]|nr:MAG: hypothetical protein ABS44_11755 [Chryseobacterium sp. SCN 40-13]